MILLIVWSANGNGSAFTSKTSSEVIYDDTYRWVCAIAIVISFGQIEQGKKSLIYLTRKTFLKHAVVCLKRCRPLKCHSNFFWGGGGGGGGDHIHIYVYGHHH